ncbi:MAG TPA: sigma-54 dependent transcriptional regulator [Candidatus Paceibacterota bacterium]|nr:sigma-54 dependent transcriptional regulator [Candidatus Paceibacterota bacterium]HRZ57070.1 sigma-54 dependent transcriptional regulator [Candidatus Paceibacterota bacterium]
MKPTRLVVLRSGKDLNVGLPLLEGLCTQDHERLECIDLGAVDLSSEGDLSRVGRVLSTAAGEVLLLWLGSQELVQLAEGFFAAARRHHWDVPVLVAVESAKAESLAHVLSLGASDFVTLPLRREDLLARLSALRREPTEVESTLCRLRTKHGLAPIVGDNPAFVELVRQLPVLARCDACLLLTGETGSGKDLFARAVHYLGPRAGKPFVTVNCGAIPSDLVENELFGHEPGAYTSATASRRGVIPEADHGTLFLDEIDCLTPLAQVKLLRFLQDGQFRPLGSERSCHADVRIIAATNTDLGAALAAGRFRHDFYYRLNVLTLNLPPLRQRPDDIPRLARSFLTKYAQKFGAPARELSPAAVSRLLAYDWPGNVRELENVVERAVALSVCALIQPADLRLPQSDDASPSDLGFRELKARAISEFERNYLRQLLVAHGGNITHAARAAHKDRRALWELLRKHHIVGSPASAAPG